MKKNRLLALLLAAMMLLGLMAGCGNDSGSNSPAPSQGSSSPKPSDSPKPSGDPAPAPVELNVVTSYGGDDGNRKNYENAVASYEAATGNKILDASATSNEEQREQSVLFHRITSIILSTCFAHFLCKIIIHPFAIGANSLDCHFLSVLAGTRKEAQPAAKMGKILQFPTQPRDRAMVSRAVTSVPSPGKMVSPHSGP